MFPIARHVPGARSFVRCAACLCLVGVVALATGCSKPVGQNDTGASKSTSSTGTVAKVSKYDSGPRASETGHDESLAEKGKGLFQAKGCSACHTFGAKSAGPDLAGVSKRRTIAWMEQQILHPEVMAKEDPIARGLFAQFALQMPNQGVAPEEARAIIEYFKYKDHEAGESH